MPGATPANASDRCLALFVRQENTSTLSCLVDFECENFEPLEYIRRSQLEHREWSLEFSVSKLSLACHDAVAL